MSGRRNFLRKYHNIVDGDMSQATVTSPVTNIEGLDNIGIQLIWTGTPTGTFEIQVSANYAADYLGNVTDAGTWTAMTLTPSPAASGVAGDIYADIAGLSAAWIRIKYTRTSGSGTLNGYITGKVL